MPEVAPPHRPAAGGPLNPAADDAYSYNGRTYSNGTWKQDGAKVYWECNGRYCEYEGTVRPGGMTVRAWNVTGGRWTLTIKPAKSGGAAAAGS